MVNTIKAAVVIGINMKDTFLLFARAKELPDMCTDLRLCKMITKIQSKLYKSLLVNERNITTLMKLGMKMEVSS